MAHCPELKLAIIGIVLDGQVSTDACSLVARQHLRAAVSQLHTLGWLPHPVDVENTQLLSGSSARHWRHRLVPLNMAWNAYWIARYQVPGQLMTYQMDGGGCKTRNALSLKILCSNRETEDVDTLNFGMLPVTEGKKAKVWFACTCCKRCIALTGVNQITLGAKCCACKALLLHLRLGTQLNIISVLSWYRCSIASSATAAVTCRTLRSSWLMR